MADNLRKYTTQEVLNKVYTNSSGNTIGLQAQTSKETLNAVLSSSTDSLNVSLAGSNTITGDVTISGDLTVQGGGSLTYDEMLTGTMSITTTDNSDNLTLISTDTDANSGPNLRLYRNSGSDAEDSDILGLIDFDGRNDNSQDYVATRIKVAAGDVSDGTEDAQLEFDVMTNGTLREYLRMASGSTPAVIFNQDSRDIDFRVLSDNLDPAFFVQGSDGKVGIGTASPAKPIHISSSDNQPLRVESTDAYAGIQLKDNGSSTLPPLISALSDDLLFYGGHASSQPLIMFLDSSTGAVGIGLSAPTAPLHVKGANNSYVQLWNNHSDVNIGGMYNNAGHGVLQVKNSSGATKVNLNTSADTYFTGGNVGIGTSSPDTNLHIHKATAGVVDSNANAQLTIENNSHAGLQFLSPVGANNIIYFGNNNDADVAYIGYIHSSNDLQFFINDGVRLQLDTNSRISLSNNNVSGATNNTIFGKLSGDDLASGGAYNSLFGENAGHAISTGVANTAIGYDSLKVEDDGNDSTAIGYQTLTAQTGVTGRVANTAVGYMAGTAITTGKKNTMLGALAGHGAEEVSDSVILGYGAGFADLEDTADGTVAIGFSALGVLTSGGQNTAIGYKSQDANTTGSWNTTVGYNSGGALIAGSNSNTAIGAGALSAGNNVATDNNTCVGSASGDVIIAGHTNTIIGADSDPSAAGGTNQATLGYGVTGVVNDSVTLGNASVDAVYMNQNKTAKVLAGGIAFTGSELTVSSGAVTATGSYHRIDTEGDAGTDSLVTINGGVDGQLLILQSAGSARDTTLEDTGDAGGNLFLSADFTLSHAQDSITLLYSSTDSGWIEVSRSDNG